MADFLGALIYDSGINLDGLRRDSEAAKKRLVDIGETAKKTFQNDIARGLAKAVRPEHFAADVAKAKAILGSIGPDTSKILERELGRNLARKTLQPFLDESRTLGAQIKSSLSSSFSIKNIAGGFLAADLVSSTLRGLFDIGAATVNIARDAAETRNKFNVIFGDLSDEVRAFANSYADSVGRARIDTEDFLSTISGIFTTVGFAGREAANFSKEITKLTFDLASFFNTTDNEALTALRAGLIGESEPLRRFNVFLSEARLETEALAFGIKKTGKEFSDQEKTFLRYQIIMKDTALAQGDALRTAESFANQQKAFSANLKNLGESVGNVVLPPLNSLISVVNDIIKSFENTTEIEDAEKRLIKFGIAADEISFRRMIDKSIELSDKARQLREDYTLLAKDTKVLGEVVRSIFPDRALDVIASEKEAQKVIEFTKLAGFRLQIEQKITGSKRKAAEFELAIATAGEDERKRLSANLRIELDRIENLQKVITAQDEIARAEKEAVEARERAAEAQERIEAGAQAVSDNVQTLSSSAKNTADNFERSAKAVKEIELSLESGEGFSAFKKSFQTQIDAKFNTPKFEIDEGAFNAFKKSFQNQQKELYSGLIPSEQDKQKIAEKQRELIRQAVDGMFDLLGQLNIGADKFIGSLQKLSNALLSGNIFGAVTSGLGLISQLFSKSTFDIRKEQTALDKLEDEKNRLLEIARIRTDRYNEALRRINETIQTGTVAELEKQLAELNAKIAELEKITDPRRIPKELEDLKKLRDELLEKIKNFGKVGEDFASQLEFFNLQLSLLNVTDPIKKLSLFTEFLKTKFGAKLPESISDFIKQGLDALQRAGLDPNFLTDFLKAAGLEELTAEQFKNLLQVLNDFINGTKTAVDDLTGSTTRVALIRSITFEQGNRLLDENTTMRILQTNMVDIQMQMLSIMKDSLRGGLSSAALSRGGAANIFIMRDGNVRRASSSELTELERLQADRFLAEAKGMGLA